MHLRISVLQSLYFCNALGPAGSVDERAEIFDGDENVSCLKQNISS